MNDCENTRELITACVYDRLDPLEEAALQAHLSHCSDCLQWRTELEAAAPIMRELGEAPFPPGFSDRIRKRATSRGLRLVKILSTLAAGVAIGLMLASLFAPATARHQLGEYLQAARWFFRQAEMIDPARAAKDFSLLRREMDAVGLEERNRLLLQSTSDPLAREWLTAAGEVLESIRTTSDPRPIRDKIRASELLEKADRIARRNGIEPRPLSPAPTPVLNDAAMETFYQARANLYAGNYRGASILFDSLSQDASYKEDALYWSAIAAGREREFSRALDRILRAARGRWGDRRTAEQILAIGIECDAVFEGKPASEATVEGVERMMKGAALVVSIPREDGRPMVIVAPRSDPLVRKFEELLLRRSAGRIGADEFNRERGRIFKELRDRSEKK